MKSEDDPIFLPIALVTGLSTETPTLRRLRETGDPLALRMLVDLYGLVEPHAAGGVPLSALRMGPPDDAPPRRLAEHGAYALWQAEFGETRHAGGPWTAPHPLPGADQDGWAPFWARVTLLEGIGALTWEPWLFDSPSPGVEPLFPLPSDMWPTTAVRASRPAPDAPALDALHDSLHEIAALICAPPAASPPPSKSKAPAPSPSPATTRLRPCEPSPAPAAKRTSRPPC